MSLEMITWALKQNVKNSQFQVLIAIANEADSDGVCFTGQAKLAYKANVTDRTLRTCISQFREMGLLHTERRTMTFGRGRKTDAIILHPEVKDFEKAPYPHADEDRKRAARNRKKYEVIPSYEPMDNSPEDQPENFSGRSKVPSQAQPENFSARTFNRKTQVLQPENSGASTGKIQQSAFNRNARAINPLKDPVNQSVNLPLKPESPQVPNPVPPMTDRLTDYGKKENICGIPAPDFLKRLRSGLSRYHNVDTHSFTDAQLQAAVEEILFSRADLTRITSPVGFCIKAIANEPGGVSSILEASTLRALRQKQVAAEETLRQQSATQLTCPKHNLDYSAGGECRSCAADRKAAPSEELWASSEHRPFQII